jgi:predicted acyltransferase
MDGLGWKWLGYPLIVAGANSILLYVMGQTLSGWTSQTLTRHFGTGLFELYGLVGSQYAPIVQSCSVLLVFWLFVFWLYRQRIFVRI